MHHHPCPGLVALDLNIDMIDSYLEFAGRVERGKLAGENLQVARHATSIGLIHPMDLLLGFRLLIYFD